MTPLYAYLYDTPDGNEEYHAWFATVEDAKKAFDQTFGKKSGYSLVSIVAEVKPNV